MNTEQARVLWKLEYYDFFDELEKFILEWETKLKKEYGYNDGASY